jgi:hypothetical protein
MEIGKALLVSAIAATVGWRITKLVNLSGSRLADVEALALIGLAWVGTVAVGLWLTRSKLPQDLRSR